MLKNAEVSRQKNAGNVLDIKQNERGTKPEDFYFDPEVFLKIFYFQ